jgi:hypothetical protein
MNEPSNFVEGSIDGCTTNNLDNPPFTPRMRFSCASLFKHTSLMSIDVLGNTLSSKTLCPSAQQYLSQHYNLHSMYGYFEAQATNL